MGVRLYPVNQEPSLLEKLAEVPAGTHAKLQMAMPVLIEKRKGVGYYLMPGESQLRAARTFDEREALIDECMQIMFEPENMDIVSLNNFKLWGWGRIKSTTSAYLRLNKIDQRPGNSEDCGRITDPEEVIRALHYQGVSTDRTDGKSAIICGPYCASVDVPVSEIGGLIWA